MVYTTNPIEALNRQLRKAIKTKGHFPNEEATRKRFGVAATSATDAWAFGFYHPNGTQQVLMEHWGSKSWTIQSSPGPSSADRPELLGVAATSADNAWAVGDCSLAVTRG